MDSFETSGDRPPLGDLTNKFEPESRDKFQPQIQDANERKRERERARYAAMPNEKRVEINKKRREARKKKKGNSTNRF